MNILVTSHFFSPSVGGIEYITELLADYFSRSGHNVLLLTQTSVSNILDDDKYVFKVIRNPSLKALWRSYLWSDIVFQNNIQLRCLWPLFFIRRPLVIGLQTWIRTTSGRRGFVQLLKQMVLHLSDHVIACSNAIRNDSFKSATVIGNPYNNTIFYDQNEIKEKNSIVFLGRLVSDKGIDLLLEACALLTSSSYNLTIIGSGPEEPFLRQITKQLKIVDSVTFVGSVQGDDLAKVLNRHEIMVVPSRWREPFGIVALEGMACGCVVIAASGGGLIDAVGEAGIIFERDNPRDLSEKLCHLLNSPDRQEILRNKAKCQLPKFSSDFICNKYLDILNNVFAESKRQLLK